MDFFAFTLTEPTSPPYPVVVDSPHSGRQYPGDFDYICPLPLLRQAEDFVVDELVAGAPEAGATVIAANFPRSYIDVNRAENDLDPAILAEPWDAPLELSERTPFGLGLVRRLCLANMPVYAEALTKFQVKQRIMNYYRPYHDAIATTLDQRLSMFGVGYLLNFHSMPSRGQDNLTTQRPDFILGDRNGTSCDPAFTRMVSDLLQDRGYSVALNEPYKGMEIVRRHGSPRSGRHALQIEINRRLYMDERAREKNEGFGLLQQNLTNFFVALSVNLAEASQPLAAE